MIDTVHLNKLGIPENLLQDEIKDIWKKKFDKKRRRYIYQTNLNFGKFKSPITLKYDKVIKSLKIEFSLHRYLCGENYKNYNLQLKGKNILRQINSDLRQFIKIKVNDFNVNRFDIGININTQLEPEYYINTLDGLLPKKIGRKQKRYYKNETLLVSDKTTSMLLYDKVKKLESQNIIIKDLKNVLRIEYQVKNSQGIKANYRFNRNLKFEGIFSPRALCIFSKLLLKTFIDLFPYSTLTITDDIESVIKHLNNCLSKKDILTVLSLFNKFQNQTTTINLIEQNLKNINSFSMSKRRKVIRELQTLLISNAKLGYRPIIEEIYTAIVKEIKKQGKGRITNLYV